MKQQRSFLYALVLASAGALFVAGCGNSDDQGASDEDSAASEQATQQPADSSGSGSAPAAQTSKPEPACPNCGTVVSIQKRDTQREKTSKEAIGGAVAGAIAGVATGNQIGSGSGKDIARIVGGIGGAVAGHEAGKRAFTEGYYAVSVDMKNGGTKRINVPDSGGLQVGQKVRVNNDTITPR